MFVNRTVRLMFLFVIIAGISEQGWAQVSTASITGVVRDPSGAVVPGAQVTVTQTETQLSRATTTDSDGSFTFTTLPVGSYKLEASMTGFALHRQTGIVLTVGQIVSLPVALQLGQIEQTTTVSAEVLMVNTSDSTLSRLVDESQVEGLPLNGRQPAELVFLAPGSSNPVQNIPTQNTGHPVLQNSLVHPREIAPSLNGVRGNGVNFSLDGANNIDTYQVTGGPFPNPDATQEFSVVTSTYGARYVSAPGGAVNIVTKSGTNELHGNLWEFHRNGVMNARNFFADRHDDLKRNQFGFTAGGPIVKNHLFVFGSYEGMRLRDEVRGLTAFVPTDAQRVGDFSAVPTPLRDPVTGTPYPNNQIPLAQFNPVTRGLLPFLPRSSAPDGRIQFTRRIAQNDDQFVIRTDYSRDKHLFFGRYFLDDFSWDPLGIEDGNLLKSFRGQLHRWQNAALGHTYSASSFVSEFRLSYTRNSSTTVAGQSDLTLPGLGAKGFPVGQFPTIQFLQVQGFFQIDPGNFNGFPRDTWSLAEHIGLQRSRHQMSFGTEIQYLRAKLLTDNVQNPGSVFAGALSGHAVSDFLLGRPLVFLQSDGIFVRARGSLWGFYGEDKIRVNSKLTLTTGLRWDPYWPFRARFGRIQCFRPGQKSTVFANAPEGLVFEGDPNCNSSGTKSNLGNIQPRLGIAYSLDDRGRTVIRSGYGLYTMQFPMFSFLGFGFGQPYSRLFQLIAPGLLSDPWANFPGGSPFANGFQLDDEARPRDVRFILPVRAGSITPNLHLGYVQQWNFTLEHALNASTVVQASYVGTKGTRLSVGADENQAVFIPGQSSLGNVQQRRPFKDIAQAIVLRDDGNSNYNAFQLSVRYRTKGNLTLDSAFTAGKSIDYVSANANLILSGGPNQVPVPSNPRLRRGLSDFDLSHSWRTSFVWQIPFAKQASALAKAFLSRWQVSGIWILDAGQPFSIGALGGNSLSGNNLDHADLAPGVSAFLSTNRPRGEVINQYFNTSAFVSNAIGTFGTTGRNILRSPGLTNLDFGVTKTIPFSDRYQAVFRAEFFNLTNTPHFLPPVNAVGTPTFGRILTARDPRILQFGLKFFW
ncbi:MAG: carboxypeptidase regulatory-like domain-containing protein [Acidobacteria bacterium]|nr:carboxypeptidase regulatory-like domain-containing protein [Acidobacteriota bacterium]MCI0723153.1 carboxypeptidase regulatory-like domain-containing protein [Acidobacteriota bacterium]